MNLAHLRRLDKSFPNGVQALAGFDTILKEGEFLSLIGPSGCGKSTVLRLLAGLDTPTGGSVDWAGGRAETGFVFQEPTLMPWASAFDNVWLPLRLRRVSRSVARPRVEEALELVGLADFAAALPRTLSGGMKMRVSIARALVTRPRLLLMDEPFAALDEITRFRLNDELLMLKAELGCTVVFVTHSVFEAAYLSDRVAVMTARPGRLAGELVVAHEGMRDEAFRTSPRYAELAGQLSALLRSAAGDRLDKALLQVHH